MSRSLNAWGRLSARIPSGDDSNSALLRLGVFYLVASVALGLHFFLGRNANILMLLAALSLTVYAAQNFHNTSITIELVDWIYIGYVCVIIFSAGWSISSSATLEQAVPLIFPWVAVLVLSSARSDWVAKIVVRFAIVTAALSPLVILFDDKLAYQPFSSTGAPELRGVFFHQLYLGAFMLIALGIIAISYMNKQSHRVLTSSSGLNFAIIALLASVLFLSRTRLYVITGVLALVITLLISQRGLRKWFVVAILGIFTVFIAMNFSAIVADLNVEGVDTTLTGRTHVWAETLSAVREDTQLLGYGFGTFQLSDFDHLFGVYRPPHAHNSLIQAYFETGQVGVVALVILMLTQVAAAWRSSIRSDQYSYSLFLVLFCMFGSLAGGVIYAGSLTTPFCLMLLFLAIETRSNPTTDRIVAPRNPGTMPSAQDRAPRLPKTSAGWRNLRRL